MKLHQKRILPALAVIAMASLGACSSDNHLVEPVTSTQERLSETTQTYIITLSDKYAGKGATGRMQSLIAKLKLEKNLREIMEGEAFTGFVMNLTPKEKNLLEKNEAVANIELDVQGSLLGVSDEEGDSITVPASTQVTGWGVQLIGRGDGYATGRTAWIIDSGVQLDHPDLNVDAVRSRSFVTGSTDPNDFFGHGTNVAGILAAKDNGFGVVGVAAGAQVVSIRVLNAQGSGTASNVIAGLNYIAANAQPGDVVNFSMNFGNLITIDNAIRAIANKGVYVSIAAGNSGGNCAGWSPQKVQHQNVFTVSGLRQDGGFMAISNYGFPVDFCAPGTAIPTTKIGSDYTAGAGGTSMAAPHVGGILLMRGHVNIPVQGYVTGDPDGVADPIPSLY